jgi:hypothetical protein
MNSNNMPFNDANNGNESSYTTIHECTAAFTSCLLLLLLLLLLLRYYCIE